jgi:hypothetical protein
MWLSRWLKGNDTGTFRPSTRRLYDKALPRLRVLLKELR